MKINTADKGHISPDLLSLKSITCTILSGISSLTKILFQGNTLVCGDNVFDNINNIEKVFVPYNFEEIDFCSITTTSHLKVSLFLPML